MKILTVTLLAALAFSPLLLAYRRQKNGKNPKTALVMNIVAVFALCLLTTGMGIGGTAFAAGTADSAATAAGGLTDTAVGFIAMALSTGIACIGGGIAVASAASAAIGAISENEKVFGKALIFVALAEGIAIYGMLISLLIMLRL